MGPLWTVIPPLWNSTQQNRVLIFWNKLYLRTSRESDNRNFETTAPIINWMLLVNSPDDLCWCSHGNFAIHWIIIGLALLARTSQWPHMSVMVFQITDNSAVCSTVCAGLQQSKYQSHNHGPLWGEFTGDRWISLSQRVSNAETVSMSWRHHEAIENVFRNAVCVLKPCLFLPMIYDRPD